MDDTSARLPVGFKTMGTRAVTIQISRRRAVNGIFFFCLGMEFLIVLADVFLNYFKGRRGMEFYMTQSIFQ